MARSFLAKLIQGLILYLVVAFTLLLRLSPTSRGCIRLFYHLDMQKGPFKDH